MQIQPEQIITLTNLEFYSFHGVLEQEKVVGGYYSVSLSVSGSFDKAMENDSIGDTINYATLYDIIREEMGTPSNLLEHVAYRILSKIDEFNTEGLVKKATISITKKAPPIASFQGFGSTFTATALFE
ncbi:MAG: dihydroneopterin aldolase [Porphyromonas sp.]|nr:dihydroneopterin aldolase [Porphyromonas sp.]